MLDNPLYVLRRFLWRVDFIVASEEHGHRVGWGEAGVQGIDEPGVYGEREGKEPG